MKTIYTILRCYLSFGAHIQPIFAAQNAGPHFLKRLRNKKALKCANRPLGIVLKALPEKVRDDRSRPVTLGPS